VTLAVDTFDARATAAAEAALAKAFKLDADAPFSYASLKRAFADVDHDDVLARLTAHGVPHHPMMRMLDLIKLKESSQLPDDRRRRGVQ
jgi:hypothetical protein